jgi:hypothetical protein
LIRIGNRVINEVEVEEIAIEDVKKAVRNLKNKEAAGTDAVQMELIKYGGNKLLNRIYELKDKFERRKERLKDRTKQ